ELGMYGCKYLMESLVVNPEFTLVGAPTDVNLVRSQKNTIAFQVNLGYQMRERNAGGINRRVNLYSYVRSSHTAFPETGRNAIVMLFDFLKHSIDNGFEIRFTQITGGGRPNSVPDFARAEFYLTSHQFEDYKRFFSESQKGSS